MNSIDNISQNAANEICNLSPVMRSRKTIAIIVCDALHLARQTKAAPAPASTACCFDMSNLRVALRDMFGIAARREMAVAKAVDAWYRQTYPSMNIMDEQIDLAEIIAKLGEVQS